jgi:hypothetical protein
MEEEGRRVRAHSKETGRPYYSINYKLSLSGRDLLSMALDEMEQIETDKNGDATPPEPMRPQSDQRRNSGIETSRLSVSTVDLVASQAPGTPTSQFRRKQLNHDFSPAPAAAVEPELARRRTRSDSTIDFELNRSAPRATFDPNPRPSASPENQSMLPGFVTCLNSRNVGKYKVGQRCKSCNL